MLTNGKQKIWLGTLCAGLGLLAFVAGRAEPGSAIPAKLTPAAKAECNGLSGEGGILGQHCQCETTDKSPMHCEELGNDRCPTKTKCPGNEGGDGDGDGGGGGSGY